MAIVAIKDNHGERGGGQEGVLAPAVVTEQTKSGSSDLEPSLLTSSRLTLGLARGGGVEVVGRWCGGGGEAVWRQWGGDVEVAWRRCEGGVEAGWRQCGGGVKAVGSDCGVKAVGSDCGVTSGSSNSC